MFAFTGDRLSYERLVECPDIMRQPSFFWRRCLVEEHGGVDESLHVVMDFDFFLRIGRGRRFHYLPRNISYYRHYVENKSLSLGRRQVREMVSVYRKNGIPITPGIMRFLALKYALSFGSLKRVYDWLRELRGQEIVVP